MDYSAWGERELVDALLERDAILKKLEPLLATVRLYLADEEKDYEASGQPTGHIWEAASGIETLLAEYPAF